MSRKLTSAAAFVMSFALAAGAARAQAPAYPKNDYSKPQAWLCWPGKAGDACAADLSTTVVRPDGRETLERFKADPKAPIDCFYVYPTVSNDPGAVSDMNAGPEEINVVRQQFARLGSKCRLYAPLYRQFTRTALRAGIAGTPVPGSSDPAARRVGYEDVVDAWSYYLAHENNGRGVVLVGHSQGSAHLARLIAAEIDGKPVQARLVSAILMGMALGVDDGKDTGAFASIPLCKAAGQTGCAIAFGSFRDAVPPPENSRFGRVRETGRHAACVNPADFSGGRAGLKAYLANGEAITPSAAPPPSWVKGKPNPTTPFVAVPGLLTGQCVQKGGFSYLEVHVVADPADPRTDDISGDLIGPGGRISTDWGLHLIDANLVMGDLVDVVGAETRTYLAGRR